MKDRLEKHIPGMKLKVANSGKPTDSNVWEALFHGWRMYCFFTGGRDYRLVGVPNQI